MNMDMNKITQEKRKKSVKFMKEILLIRTGENNLTVNKEAKSLGMPWEKEYGYAQAVKVRDTIYVSGQVSHDDRGNIVGRGDMEAQMRQAYANLQKVLAQYGATVENIVDEILFVTDMDTAFAAAVKCRQDIFSGTPVVASTIVQIQRLAFPELMIEIRCVAKV
jgi:2-iminobutanoate/2-iminopropanoate deaminase